MHVPVPDRGDDEIEEDLMDEIDPDLEYAVEIKVLAGRILYGAVRNGVVTTEAEYERALLRSVELASGEWIV
jgi:hypothetical protein